MKTTLERLYEMGLLREGLEDLADIPQAWSKCQKVSWLIHVASVVKLDPSIIVLAACTAARTALPAVPDEEQRPLLAIEAAEDWVNTPTRENAHIAEQAAAASYDFYPSDNYSDAAYAACAAAYTAYTAYLEANYFYTHAVDAANHAAKVAGEGAVADAIRSVISTDDIVAALTKL